MVLILILFRVKELGIIKYLKKVNNSIDFTEVPEIYFQWGLHDIKRFYFDKCI